MTEYDAFSLGWPWARVVFRRHPLHFRLGKERVYVRASRKAEAGVIRPQLKMGIAASA